MKRSRPGSKASRPTTPRSTRCSPSSRRERRNDIRSDLGRRPNIGRSIWAVVAGFLVIIVLSLGLDEILHLAHVYPPWNEPMWDPKLNALALGYRLLFDTFGSYVTAKLAPRRALRHALIGGFLGLVLSMGGVYASTQQHMGPLWYPIFLAISSPITAWIGGTLFVRNAAGART